MAIRCPNCRTRVVLTASDVAAGRILRCPACETTWLATHLAGDVYGFRTREGAERQPLIIEGEAIAMPRSAPRRAIPPAPSAAPRARPAPAAARPEPAPATSRGLATSAGRHAGLAAGAAAAVVLGLVAVVLLVPAVSAGPTAPAMPAVPLVHFDSASP